MRLRPRRRNLVVWSSTAAPAGRSRAAPRRGGVPRRSRARPPRLRRIRWWLRTGAVLSVLGVLWLARTARVRWEPVSLLAGVLIAVSGFVLPAGGGGVFILGVLVLIVTLLTGINTQRRGDPAP